MWWGCAAGLGILYTYSTSYGGKLLFNGAVSVSLQLNKCPKDLFQNHFKVF